MNPLTILLRALIRVYQWVLAPVLGANCRYEPSCSAYAHEALGVHGPLNGSWLALRLERLLALHARQVVEKLEPENDADRQDDRDDEVALVDLH